MLTNVWERFFYRGKTITAMIEGEIMCRQTLLCAEKLNLHCIAPTLINLFSEKAGK